jgi:predicted O-linked N-acetylglucosamine transferase (SPINDLY family)
MSGPAAVTSESLTREAEAALARGDARAAVLALRGAAQLAPRDLDGWIRLARAAERAGDRDALALAWNQAIALDDRHPEVLRGYAGLCLAVNRLDMAERALRRLLEVAPGTPGARLGLALTLWRGGQGAAAHAAFADALAHDPRDLVSRWILGHQPASPIFDDQAALDAFRARWRDTLAWFERLPLDDAALIARVESALVTCTDAALHACGDDFDPEHARACALIRRFARARHPDPLPVPRMGGARPRIGFVSRYFYRHSVMKVFEALITGLDRARFEVVLFQLGQVRDEVTARLAACAGRHVAVEAPAPWWREQLQAARCDVLVYPDLGLEGTAQWLAAQRLAPVQCVLWGHPIATGLDSIDWYLTADAAERPGGEADYRERVFRLPGLGGCFAAPRERPNPAFVPPGAAGVVSFVVSQRAVKLTPRHDALWARIAAALPGAQFCFAPDRDPAVCAAFAARLARAFERAGADPAGRIHALARLAVPDFLRLGETADVHLDTLDFSGGITSLELFALDLPTVTLPGLRMRSRQTAAMLDLMEIPELVARDPDDYVRIAVDLGRDPQRRAALRARIAARKHVLYDDARPVAAFAQFLAQVTGLTPLL